MAKERKILLGVTKTGELVFGNFEITTRNGYREFTASFDTMSPLMVNDEVLYERAESSFDGMDTDAKWYLVDRFDLRPSEVPRYLVDNDGLELIDTSLYPEAFEIDGNDYYFESYSFGQHDTRKDMELYTCKPFYDLLHKVWDEYHLKEIPPEVEKELLDTYNKLPILNHRDLWIKCWLKRLINANEL